ncbi:MAG: hypothetical protein IMF10_04515 [Proteobacteria bacterium]|nr:hypothetical protein [Pseudomonadota bacterium]
MKRNTTILLAVIFIILAAVALVLNRGKLIPEAEKKPVKPVYKAEKKPPAIKEPVREKISRIKKKLKPAAPEEKPAEISETAAIVRRPVKAEKGYDEIHQEVIKFFDYLDQKNYIKAYRLKEGTYKHFLKLMGKLSAKLPVVSGETQDIYVLTHNIAHFYRVIGKKNISLVKDILSNESVIIEPTMGLFYEWITKGIEDKRKEIKTSTKAIYEYAGFFLNTLGGKAYLSRRGSRTRILVTYYSILTLDKANTENLNRHGINIHPLLTLLMDDMRNQKNLSRKDEYLKRLYAINTATRSPRHKGEK